MKVLMVSPHFPPDSSAAAHRVRLLAPHLEAYGWTPTVLTVRADAYEGSLDYDLARLVPGSLRVERCDAIPHSVTRPLGFGDLGVRSFFGLLTAATQLLSRERHDALFITIYPSYTALLGPILKRRFRIPFILDYQDPWVGEWGDTVGGGIDGRPDVKSRLTRRLAKVLEPRAVSAADAITAVSALTYEQVFSRIPQAGGLPAAAIPIGVEPADFEFARAHPRANPIFDATDGLFHLCYTGTILPLGLETLRGVLGAAASLKANSPDRFSRLRIHFVGTSNQSTPGGAPRVMEVARQLEIDHAVTEHPARIPYLDAIAVQTQASAVLLMGSSEPHYTASKLYPALLAGRPILAAYHTRSTVSSALRDLQSRHVTLVEYDDVNRAGDKVSDIVSGIVKLMDAPPAAAAETTVDASQYTARNLAARLAGIFDNITTKGRQ